MTNRITKAITQIHAKDLLAPLIFILLLLPSLIFRLINSVTNRRLLLISEDGEARDNGYHFFKYVREKHSADYCFYAIKMDSPGLSKVEKYGNIIKYGSIKHWLYYMSADLNISSQKSGNPCPVFWYFIHVTLHLYKNRVYLKHGIVKDDAKWIYYNQTFFKFIVCGAKKEYDYITTNFGYPKESVIFTGLARFDGLDNTSSPDRRKILIMPTWRNWLGRDTNKLCKDVEFKKTEYYKQWNSLITSRALIDFIEHNNIEVYFYPHHHMQKFINEFKIKSKNVKVLDLSTDIQDILKKSALMITDWSSVFMDFTYMRKPVLFFQFDREKYRKEQLQEGYFDYNKDGFGDIVLTVDDVIDAIKKCYSQDFRMEKKYLDRAEKFFEYHDQNNCERIYEAIK